MTMARACVAVASEWYLLGEYPDNSFRELCARIITPSHRNELEDERNGKSSQKFIERMSVFIYVEATDGCVVCAYL